MFIPCKTLVAIPNFAAKVAGMTKIPMSQQIIDAFNGLPAQLQKAARYIVDNPRDVALLSMREQARRAGVQPSTMTRLARQLGLSGYDAVREAYGDYLRQASYGFADKAKEQTERQQLAGDAAIAAELLRSVEQHVQHLCTDDSLTAMEKAAELLAQANHVYCLGMRASHPAAWQLHYILSLLGRKSTMLDAVADIGLDAIRYADRKDALFAVSFAPYTRRAVAIANYAHDCGMPFVALTDSPLSPLAERATHTILVSTRSPSFFHTISPAFVVAESLGTLIAGRGGDATLTALQKVDEHLEQFDTYTPPALQGEAP
jgi:DNA-binding MurR/RpiR family transcriptional regulator